MNEQAVLLTDPSSSSECDEVAKVLCFFGVVPDTLTRAEFLDRGRQNGSNLRLCCSSDVLFGLLELCQHSSEASRLWREHVHSAFVYAGTDFVALQNGVKRITHDLGSVIQADRGNSEWIVSDTFPEFCGVMSGIRVPAPEAQRETVFGMNECRVDATDIISIDGTAAFFKTYYHRVPIFLSAAAKCIDLDAPVARRNFDVREHFISSVPLVLYTKWAFPDTCWQAPEINSCLVIDDPLLKPEHGFLNFRALLDLMRRHNFSTNVAFIPWNWRRSSSTVVQLFKENPERYSLSMHGCDHTGGEFGTKDVDRLAWKARQAANRMSHLESRTGIGHDRIMVFPQGVFSEAAMEVLKHADFIAAVNTGVVSNDTHPPAISTSDMWDIALMNYRSFPIFTRRYPSQGIENCAFDILLGKPCIVVIHHDFCRDQYQHLIQFIERLNALNCRLAWRSLGDVVRRSYRRRELLPGLVEIEMYASELLVENRSQQTKRFCISKVECEPSDVKEILADSQPIGWKRSGGRVTLEIDLNPGDRTMIQVKFHDRVDSHAQCRENVSYRVTTMVRRYLSEVRDNYAMKVAPFFFSGSLWQ